MSNSYCDCNKCGQPIRLSQMEQGQWLPFEIDGTGLHNCPGKISLSSGQRAKRSEVKQLNFVTNITSKQNDIEPTHLSKHENSMRASPFPTSAAWAVVALILIMIWLLNN